MANLMRRPSGMVGSFRDELDRLFDNFFTRPEERWWGQEGSTFAPAINAYEKDKEFIVEAHVPGFNPETLDISCTGKICTIRGERRDEREREEENWVMREANYGSFTRTVDLPDYVDAESARAELNNGVLKIHFQKVPEKEQRKKIPIRSGRGEGGPAGKGERAA